MFCLDDIQKHSRRPQIWVQCQSSSAEIQLTQPVLHAQRRELPERGVQQHCISTQLHKWRICIQRGPIEQIGHTARFFENTPEALVVVLLNRNLVLLSEILQASIVNSGISPLK